MSDSNGSANSGIGFAGLLGIVFSCPYIVLKLVGVIDWSWWWVTAPLWLPTAVGVLVFAILALVAVVGSKR